MRQAASVFGLDIEYADRCGCHYGRGDRRAAQRTNTRCLRPSSASGERTNRHHPMFRCVVVPRQEAAASIDAVLLPSRRGSHRSHAANTYAGRDLRSKADSTPADGSVARNPASAESRRGSPTCGALLRRRMLVRAIRRRDGRSFRRPSRRRASGASPGRSYPSCSPRRSLRRAASTRSRRQGARSFP